MEQDLRANQALSNHRRLLDTGNHRKPVGLRLQSLIAEFKATPPVAVPRTTALILPVLVFYNTLFNSCVLQAVLSSTRTDKHSHPKGLTFVLNKLSAVLLTALAAGLLATPAHAQFSLSTGFDQTYPGTGGGAGVIETPFIFTVPGYGQTKNDNSSEANSNFNVGDTSGFNLNYDYPANVASVVVNNGGASGDYNITTTVNTDYSKTGTGYPLAGLIVFDSISSYLVFSDVHTGYDPTTTFTETLAKLPALGGNETNLHSDSANLGIGASGAGVAAGTTTPLYATLSIVKSGTTIKFNYVTTTGTSGTSYTVSAVSTGNDLIAYNYLNNINGKQVGLYTQDTYSGDTSTVNFGSFSANVSALAAAPEPSQWAAFSIGLLGLGGLTLRARRRSHIAT